MTPSDINTLIKKRRSIFPATYTDDQIPDKLIHQVLENANWAPNHRHTEPWRFKVFRSKALDRLSEFMGEAYKITVPAEKFSEKKYLKTKKKPLQSSCVIAICMQRDPKESLPEWEELAAVSCAVQNMWLTCTANKIGCYWSSPKYINIANDFLKLAEGERCLGFFFMGYHNLLEIEGKRTDIGEKVIWMEE